MLLEHHLKQLRLPTFLREYDKVARQCAAQRVDYPRYLLRLTEQELLDRERRATERRIHQARFPVVKSLDTFEFLAIPAVNKALVLELARCEFLLRRENVLLLGNSGTGKTHLALALGLSACQHGHRVRFTTAAAMVHELLEARDEKRLLRYQKQMASYELLIVDELGFVPLSKSGAELLFEVFSQRYERGSTLVTSNLPFQEWTEVLIGTADRRAAGPAHPPRSYPGDERRELSSQAEQAQARLSAELLIRQPPASTAARYPLRRTRLGEEDVFRSGLSAPPCRRRRPPLQTPSSPTNLRSSPYPTGLLLLRPTGLVLLRP